MSDFSVQQHDVTNEELSRIADAVEALVGILRQQPTERTVDLLPPVERVAGPAVGEPLGYITIDATGPAARVMLDYLEPTPGRAYSVGDVARSTSERVVAVYDLPQEVEP